MAKDKKIVGVIDPGHGGYDRWNVGKNGYVEADGVLKISKFLKEALERTGEFKIYLTRDGDYALATYATKKYELKLRGEKAGTYNPDFMISEHTNASSHRGVRGSVAFYSVKRPEQKQLAYDIADAIAKEFGVNNRGAKTRLGGSGVNDYYGIIRHPIRQGIETVILVESLFHSNQEDEEILLQDKNLRIIAELQAKVLCNYYNVEYIPYGEDKEEDHEHTLYRVQVGAFKKHANADNLQKELEENGYDTYKIIGDDGLLKVQTGAFSNKKNAENLVKKLKDDNFDAWVTTKAGKPAPDYIPSKPKPRVVAGSKVRVKKGAKTYTGGSLASYVYKNTYKVLQLKGDRAVIVDGNGTVICAINVKNLYLAETEVVKPPKPEPKPEPKIKEGSKVKVNKGAKSYDGKSLASFVYDNVYDVIQLSGDRAVIGIGKTVTTAINIEDIRLA